MTRRPNANRRAPRPPKSEPAPSRQAEFRWPSTGELLDLRAPYLIPAFLVLVTRIGVWLSIPSAAEDAYITYRFARNFANGFGFVFNPGERVFGFSSPLWTLWMALGIKLGASPVSWGRVTTLVVELVTLVIVATMLRREFSNRSAWCFAFLWGAWPYFAAVSASGMENQTMVGLIALAAAWCATRSPLTGPMLAAVALIRPEGLVSALVLGTRARWRDRLIAIAIVTAAVVALALYFGSPVPQSLIAKSRVYGTPGPWRGRYWWDWVFPFVFWRFPQVTETGHLFLLTVVLAPAAWFGARALWEARSRPLAVFTAACVAVWLGYALLGVAYFWWYFTMPITGFFTIAAVGFPRLARGPALFVSGALLTVGLWTVSPQLYLGRARNEALDFGGVAAFLAQHAQPGQKVLLEPIGMVGYGSPVRVVDEVGLVSPQVARRRAQGPGWYTDVVAQERPDWIVARRGMLTGGRVFAGIGAPFRAPAEREALLARYRVEAVLDTSGGDNSLIVMSRR